MSEFCPVTNFQCVTRHERPETVCLPGTGICVTYHDEQSQLEFQGILLLPSESVILELLRNLFSSFADFSVRNIWVL